MKFTIGFKIPKRSFRIAMRYWRPKRLTINDPAIYAWLWWNFSFDERVS